MDAFGFQLFQVGKVLQGHRSLTDRKSVSE
jgi:hypothetical protein